MTFDLPYNSFLYFFANAIVLLSLKSLLFHQHLFHYLICFLIFYNIFFFIMSSFLIRLFVTCSSKSFSQQLYQSLNTYHWRRFRIIKFIDFVQLYLNLHHQFYNISFISCSVNLSFEQIFYHLLEPCKPEPGAAFLDIFTSSLFKFI